MDFFYETGIYVVIVVLAALAEGFIIYALMTKARVEKRPARSKRAKQEGNILALLKPTKRPLKPEMEPRQTFSKPEMELPKLETEADTGLLQQVPSPELRAPRNDVEGEMEQLETSDQDVDLLPDLHPADEQEPLVENEKRFSNLSLGPSELGSEESEEEEKPEPKGEDSILDLFKTAAEGDREVYELAKNLEDIEISDLLAEVKRVRLQFKQ